MSVDPSGAWIVSSKLVVPMNGPGICRKPGKSAEPVNEPQRKKIVITEMIEAARFGVTALSSPKVTVFSEV